MTFRKKIIMVSNDRFDNQNEYSISDITNKISTLEGKINSGGSGSYVRTINNITADSTGNVSLIDSGTNYIRFSDGTQICWGENVGNAAYGRVGVAFSKPFIFKPSLNITAVIEDILWYISDATSPVFKTISDIGSCYYGLTTTGFGLQSCSTHSWTAIGKWK